VQDWAFRRPAPPLVPFVAGYQGYRMAGLPPARHVGLPSPFVTLILTLDDPLTVAVHPDPAQPAACYDALVGGLHTRPALIVHDGAQSGVQVSLDPLGARALLGLPAGELADVTVDLTVLLGRDANEALHRMADAPDWAARFAVLDDVLLRRLDLSRRAADPLELAWREVVRRGPGLRVDDLAGDVGWSRRHLTERFTREFGLGPKELARVVRFERSKKLLQRGGFGSLAEVAAECGYYDQAHLAREWRQLAGCAPSAWLASEDLPSVQALGDEPAHAPVS
jgi:AraC-like DNA-binding protein